MFYVFVSVVGMAVTSMIIGRLGQGISMRSLVLQVLMAFAGYGVLNMIKGYLEARNDGQYIEARTELFIMDWIEKDLTISMEQYEDPAIRRLKERATDGIWSNDLGVEGFFRQNTELLKSVLGLMVYALLVGSMNWKILLMLIGMSAVSAAAAYTVTRYYQKIKDPLAEHHMTMHYINREVDDVQGGKDIRMFGLENWIIKYQTLLRGKSVLFISHRLASTRFCDRILFLSEGRICEQGTHEELMQEQGAYYEMFQVQSRYYNDGV